MHVATATRSSNAHVVLLTFCFGLRIAMHSPLVYSSWSGSLSPCLSHAPER
jgi:hypothetical protein